MHSSYNQSAIEIATRLQQARASLRAAGALKDVPREKLFMPHNRSGLGVALEYEAMGGTPVSPALQQRADDLGIEFEHLGLTLGTVIHHVDLKQPADDALIAFIRQTLLERKVIFFRDQHLSEDQQVDFGRRFGELDAFPFGKPGNNPYILEIVHGPTNPGAENSWHTDVTWMEQPSLGSIAQCVELPPVGGDTLFSDSHACYLGLPFDVKERLQTLHGINDYRVFITPGRGPGLDEELVAAIKAQIPFGVSHPLLRTHPETGKTGLYIHGGFLRHDSIYDINTGTPLGKAESEALAALLQKQHLHPEYQCRFHWQPGSIAFWDNRAVQHYAVNDYFPHARRLRRVTVSGDKPFYAPAD